MLSSTTFALMLIPVFAQAQHAEPVAPEAAASAIASAKMRSLKAADVATRASGQIELAVGRDSPIYAEFQRSSALTQRLREALQEKGFELASEAGSSKATLQFRGDITLTGGPKFHRGVKVPIGEATERALKLAKDNRQLTTAEVADSAVSLALSVAAFKASINNFTRGLAINGLVNVLGEMTGC